MVEQILQHFNESAYDFRDTANPADPLAFLFPDWVPYYRLKAAIAQAIKPARILEIGVRYGYSGAAFLYGHPAAHFTGIDLDSDSFGGSKGAIAWAHKILPRGQAELIVGNSQSMPRFPGDRYDLIHIDGQQDGDGSYRDLAKALRQGRFILLDGYFWTGRNFRASGEFLLQHQHEIEYYFVIPGYAGELLIKVRDQVPSPPPSVPPQSSLALRAGFDAGYYRRTWRGWNPFAKDQGKSHSDLRLRTIFDLAMIRHPQQLLDLGCGRGEIAALAARAGCRAQGLDYSAAAIAIAGNLLADEPAAAQRVQWSEQEVGSAEPWAPFDAAVAASLVEHLSPAETERLYAKVAAGLAPGGIFVVHSATNRWFRDYHYPRCRRLAATVEAYLPPDPKTPGDQLRTINEQSPRTLRRELSRHFKHVLVWLGSAEHPAASLLQPLRRAQLMAQPELFALASHQPIDPEEVRQLVRSTPLDPAVAFAISITTPLESHAIPAQSLFTIPVEVANNSRRWLCSQPPDPVHLSYHWIEQQTGVTVVFDGNRTQLVPALGPSRRGRYLVSCLSPVTPGHYLLGITLVQENVQWFDSTNPSAAAFLPVTVVA